MLIGSAPRETFDFPPCPGPSGLLVGRVALLPSTRYVLRYTASPIEVGPPAVPAAMKLSISANGIELVNGANKISLSAASVSVNDGALEVI